MKEQKFNNNFFEINSSLYTIFFAKKLYFVLHAYCDYFYYLNTHS